MKTQMIHARIDQNLKQEVELIFSSLGINTADAIRMFLTQVTLNKGLPFDVKIPNKETQKAMEELRTNKKLKSYSAPEFHELLNAQ
jgi:DNA-damage-inducible protein J